jgi:hypothetical protein
MLGLHCNRFYKRISNGFHAQRTGPKSVRVAATLPTIKHSATLSIGSSAVKRRQHVAPMRQLGDYMQKNIKSRERGDSTNVARPPRPREPLTRPAKPINAECPIHIANKQSSNPTRRPSSRPDRTTASGNKTKRTCHVITKRFRSTADTMKVCFDADIPGRHSARPCNGDSM